MKNPVTLERISILRDTIREMNNEIACMTDQKKHLRSTFIKSNKYRRSRIAVKVNLINHQILSCYKIITQSEIELCLLGAI